MMRIFVRYFVRYFVFFSLACFVTFVLSFALYLAINWTNLPYGWTWLEGKTLWNVLELLIIPVTLAGVAAYLDRLERKTDRENVKDNQREALLQSYIEFMTRLVLEKGLRESEAGDGVWEIAQAKTETTYQRLNPKRNEALVKFLESLGLVGGVGEGNTRPQKVISLKYINLTGTFLYSVGFPRAVLFGANLSEAFLGNANLPDADLGYANLRGADLSGANLRGADLGDANLIGADLRVADLNGADLSYARLFGAKLDGATMENANVEGARFFLARMPDGKIYNPRIHTAEKLTKPKRTESGEGG